MDNQRGAVKTAGVISAQNEEEMIATSLRDMLGEALEKVGYGAEVDSLRNGRQRTGDATAWTERYPAAPRPETICPRSLAEPEIIRMPICSSLKSLLPLPVI